MSIDYKYNVDPVKTTSITSARVTTSTVDLSNLIINGFLVNDVALYLGDDSNSATRIATEKAVNDIVYSLNKKISDIDPYNNIYVDNTVISLPITDSSFNDAYWDAHHWTITRGVCASFTGGDDTRADRNFLKMVNHPFAKNTSYFVVVDVDVLDSGTLRVYDNDNKVVAETRIIGAFSFMYYPTSTSSALLKFIAEDVIKNELVTIKSVKIYSVSERLMSYLNYIIPIIASDQGKELASKDYVTEALETLSASFTAALNKVPNESRIAQLENHIYDRRTNPHGITLDLLNGAHKEHTHTLESLGAASVAHTHTTESLGAAKATHTHTPKSIGAAPTDHTHTYSQVGAAPEEHEHLQYMTRIDVQNIIAGTSISTNTNIMNNIGDASKVMCMINGKYADDLIYGTYVPPMPINFIQPTKLIHRCKNILDPTSGIVSCSTPRAVGNRSALWNIFYSSKDNEALRYCVFNKVVRASEPVIIKYKFFNKKYIKGYTICRYSNYAAPASWTIANELGDELDSKLNLNWSSNETEKYFSLSSPKYANELSFKISGLSDIGADTWGIHIEVEFGVENNTSDTLLAFTTDQTKFITTNKSGNVNTAIAKSGIIKVNNTDSVLLPYLNAIYPVADITDNDIKYSYTKCSPEYSYERHGIPLFRDFNNTKQGPAFGTISANASVVGGMHDLIYNFINQDATIDLDKGITTVNGINDITFTHVNIPKLNMTRLKLYLRSNDITDGIAPKKIAITYTREMNAVNQQGTMIVPEIDEYGNKVLDGTINSDKKIITYTATITDQINFMDVNDDIVKGFDSSTGTINDGINYVITEINLPKIITNITGLTYRFIGKPTSQNIRIASIQPYFTEDWFNINTNVLYNVNDEAYANRVYLGICEVYNDARRNTIVHPLSTPIGTEVFIPYMLEGTSDQSTTIEILNPFFSSLIEVTPVSYSNSNNNGQLVQSMKIKNITPDRITMVVSPYNFKGVRIRRLW